MTELLIPFVTREPTVFLDTKDYTDITMHKQGVYGITWRAKTRTGDTVALKTFDPSPKAKEIMAQLDLSLEMLAAIDDTGFAANANIVPTRSEIDKNGVHFTSMPFYEQTLHSLEQAAQEAPPRKALPSGFTLDVILRHGDDVINGVAEYQRRRKKAHRDITANNIHWDEEAKKLLISDPAPSRGHPYVRSPFAKRTEVAPLSADGYATASLLTYLFTGKYLDEDRITAAFIEGGSDAVDAHFATMDTSTDIGKKRFTRMLDDSLSGVRIPKHIRSFIEDAAWQRFDTAQEMQSAYRAAVKKHDAATVRRNTLRWMGVGAGIIAMVTGAKLAADFFAPVPQYAKLIESEAIAATNLQALNVDESLYSLEFELSKDQYLGLAPLPFTPNREQRTARSNNRTHLWQFDRADSSYVNVISRAVIESAADLGVELPWSELKQRYIALFPWPITPMSASQADLISEEQLLHYLVGRGMSFASMIRGGSVEIDVETALTVALAGVDKFAQAREMSDSKDFVDFAYADKMKFVDAWMYAYPEVSKVIHPDIRTVILRTSARLQESLPQDKYSVLRSPSNP